MSMGNMRVTRRRLLTDGCVCVCVCVEVDAELWQNG